MKLQFHQGLVEELRFQLQRKGVLLDNDTAQMAMSGIITEEDLQAQVRDWILESVSDVLSSENRFDIMLRWESENEGKSPFYIEQIEEP